MRLAIAQLNTTVGDLEGNRTLILDAHREAAKQGADLVLYPELVTCGYPPQDLVTRPDFVSAVAQLNHHLAESLSAGPAAVFGTLEGAAEGASRSVHNSAWVVDGGRILGRHDKILLPAYDVFDESRTFEPGGEAQPIEIRGHSVGIAICEDLWTLPVPGQPPYPRQPGKELVDKGATLILCPSASPFHEGRHLVREQVFCEQSRQWGVPLALANLVGGNTELIFDGRSFLVKPDGNFLRLPTFESAVFCVDELSDSEAEVGQQGEALAEALILGIQDFLGKCGLQKVVLGLSGGIDSAVVAVLATAALGAENVTGVAMPGPYSSDGALTDAEELARNLGIDFEVVSIEETYQKMHTDLESLLGSGDWGVAQENLQSRLRGNILMTIANRTGAMVLATGNKSELSVGYCTLYGDMCGGLAPLGDVSKQGVYQLARLDRFQGQIPISTIDKPPSAELAPDQVDTDSLPPYDQLDAILTAWIEERRSFAEIVAQGIPEESVRQVIRLIELSEHKRRQSAPILRVTPRAYGVGRRVPIARSLDGWQYRSQTPGGETGA